MKKVTRCYECKKLVRTSDTYLIDIAMEYQHRLCPVCTDKAGYKVSKKKLSKYIKDERVQS